MNLKELKKVISLFESSKLTELQIEEKDLSLFMKKGGDAAPITMLPPQPVAAVPAPIIAEMASPDNHPHKEAKVDENLKIIDAPMVGTFYRAPSPTNPPYVNVGDTVVKGQTLCILEAMKLMNEIESPYDGKIVKILIEGGEAVEYGTQLFLIDPT